MITIYVGRIVAVGLNPEGKAAALYRISSRSFPNRTAILGADRVSVVPKEGFVQDVFKNPYITYNAIQVVGDVVVVSNGSHTNPIAEKLASGMGIRDALAYSLLGLDYEHDSLDTPRIAGVIKRGGGNAYLGIIRKDKLHVAEVQLQPGELAYLSTYERNDVDPAQREAFAATDPIGAAQTMLSAGVFAGMTHPVLATCALETGDGFVFAKHDVE